MKKHLLLLCFLYLFVSNAFNQVTIFDFETPQTTTDFQYFGSSLENQLTSVESNPDPSGINTSDNVVRYVKPGDALTYAGAFSNPDPSEPIDVTNGGEICVQVNMNHIGNLALKLETSLTGSFGPDWILAVPNTKVNEWEQLCFNVSLPSMEAPFQPATGYAYGRVILFFDFNSPGTGSSVISYFDNIVLNSGGTPTDFDVTFSVNMADYSGSFDGVFLRGSFNNWSEDNPMTDMGNGIWETTLTLPPDSHEYKFWLSGADVWETFTGLETCTITTPDGAFTNRLLLLTEDVTLPTFCFNNCYACGNSVDITFELGMGAVEPSPDGVWLAGGGNFDAPGGPFKMSDPDGDNVFTITVNRQKGFSSFYSFANGNCPDFSCKEDLTGLPCGDPNNFNDRTLPPVQGDTLVATCFGDCFSNSDCVVATRDLKIDQTIFSLSPNLVDGHALLSFSPNLAEEKVVRLFNELGEVMQQTDLGKNTTEYQLNTSSLTSGLYLVHVQIGNKIATQKIIKK